MHLIDGRDHRLIVEVGAFVGGSVMQWLDVSPNMVVVAMEPWPQIIGPNAFYDSHPGGRAQAGQLRGPDSLFNAFQSTLWDKRERVVPARGTGESMLPVPHALGLRPDLIFIDADKQAREIDICDDGLIDDRPWTMAERWLWLEGLRTAWGLRRTARSRVRRGLDRSGNRSWG